MDCPDGVSEGQECPDVVPTGSYRTLVFYHSPLRTATIPLKTHQDHTHPHASSVGVVKDRSFLMGLSDGSNGPTGSCRT